MSGTLFMAAGALSLLTGRAVVVDDRQMSTISADMAVAGGLNAMVAVMRFGERWFVCLFV